MASSWSPLWLFSQWSTRDYLLDPGVCRFSEITFPMRNTKCLILFLGIHTYIYIYIYIYICVRVLGLRTIDPVSHRVGLPRAASVSAFWRLLSWPWLFLGLLGCLVARGPGRLLWHVFQGRCFVLFRNLMLVALSGAIRCCPWASLVFFFVVASLLLDDPN